MLIEWIISWAVLVFLIVGGGFAIIDTNRAINISISIRSHAFRLVRAARTNDKTSAQREIMGFVRWNLVACLSFILYSIYIVNPELFSHATGGEGERLATYLSHSMLATQNAMHSLFVVAMAAFFYMSRLIRYWWFLFLAHVFASLGVLKVIGVIGAQIARHGATEPLSTAMAIACGHMALLAMCLYKTWRVKTLVATETGSGYGEGSHRLQSMQRSATFWVRADIIVLILVELVAVPVASLADMSVAVNFDTLIQFFVQTYTTGIHYAFITGLGYYGALNNKAEPLQMYYTGTGLLLPLTFIEIIGLIRHLHAGSYVGSSVAGLVILIAQSTIEIVSFYQSFVLSKALKASAAQERATMVTRDKAKSMFTTGVPQHINLYKLAAQYKDDILPESHAIAAPVVPAVVSKPVVPDIKGKGNVDEIEVDNPVDMTEVAPVVEQYELPTVNVSLAPTHESRADRVVAAEAARRRARRAGSAVLCSSTLWQIEAILLMALAVYSQRNNGYASAHGDGGSNPIIRTASIALNYGAHGVAYFMWCFYHSIGTDDPVMFAWRKRFYASFNLIFSVLALAEFIACVSAGHSTAAHVFAGLAAARLLGFLACFLCFVLLRVPVYGQRKVGGPVAAPKPTAVGASPYTITAPVSQNASEEINPYVRVTTEQTTSSPAMGDLERDVESEGAGLVIPAPVKQSIKERAPKVVASRVRWAYAGVVMMVTVFLGFACLCKVNEVALNIPPPIASLSGHSTAYATIFHFCLVVGGYGVRGVLHFNVNGLLGQMYAAASYFIVGSVALAALFPLGLEWIIMVPILVSGVYNFVVQRTFVWWVVDNDVEDTSFVW